MSAIAAIALLLVAADPTAAARLRADAQAALQAGEGVRAAPLLERALELDPGHAEDWLDLASAYARWDGRCADARAALERYASECKSACAPPARADAVAASCRAQVVVAAVAGARVAIDGAPVAMGRPAAVWSGAHVVTATLASGRIAERVVCVSPGAAPVEVALDAAGARAGPESQMAAASRHEKAAIAALRAGEWCAAAFELERAHRAVPNAEVLMNLAVVHEKWEGHACEAIPIFARYVAACPSCKRAGEARSRAASLEARCASEVKIASVPPGAEIAVDGAASGRAPVTVKVPAGRHVAAASLAGHAPWSVPFHVVGGRPADVSIVLEPVASAAPPPEPAPEPPPPVAAVARPLAPEPLPPSGLRPWGWASGAVGVALAGAGAVFAARAYDDRDRFEALEARVPMEPDRPFRDELGGIASELDRDRALAYAGFAIGAAALAAGAYLLWATWDEP